MQEEITCPVCGLERISYNKSRCPQCDADLTCFKVLSSLPDEPVREKYNRETGIPVRVFIILFIGLIAIIITSQLFWFMQFKIILSEQQSSLADSMRIIASALENLAQNRPEPVVVKPEVLNEKGKPEDNPGQMNFWTYRVKEGDTLWIISKMYYGSGHYYPVLLEHNPHLGIYSIPIGSRVKILKNAVSAENEYSSIIISEGDKSYWNYTVTEGDTLESLAVKFYKNEKGADRIFNLNPNLRIKAGESIKILLK